MTLLPENLQSQSLFLGESEQGMQVGAIHPGVILYLEGGTYYSILHEDALL